jgi:hypothetical protein
MILAPDPRLNRRDNKLAYSSGASMLPFWAAEQCGIWITPRYIRRRLRRWIRKGICNNQYGFIHISKALEDMGIPGVKWSGISNVNGRPVDLERGLSCSFMFVAYRSRGSSRVVWAAVYPPDANKHLYCPLGDSSIQHDSAVESVRFYTLPPLEVDEEDL